jgi:hypothetical protein
MFNLFKKKPEKQYEDIVRYDLTIQLVEDQKLIFQSTTEYYPKEWGELIYWYEHTRGTHYCFSYKEGVVAFNRDNILFIRASKNTYQQEITIP